MSGGRERVVSGGACLVRRERVVSGEGAVVPGVALQRPLLTRLLGDTKKRKICVRKLAKTRFETTLVIYSLRAIWRSPEVNVELVSYFLYAGQGFM